MESCKICPLVVAYKHSLEAQDQTIKKQERLISELLGMDIQELRYIKEVLMEIMLAQKHQCPEDYDYNSN